MSTHTWTCRSNNRSHGTIWKLLFFRIGPDGGELYMHSEMIEAEAAEYKAGMSYQWISHPTIHVERDT